jgi:ribokinase
MRRHGSRKIEMPLILNVSPIAAIDAASRAALLDAADIVLVNEIEAAALLGVTAETETLSFAASAAMSLARNRRAAVITLGTAGVVCCSGAASSYLPSHSITVIDTTACGDAFAGAFASAIERGEPIQTAAAFGNAAGALAAANWARTLLCQTEPQSAPS